MRWLAKLLFPKIVADQEKFVRLRAALYEVRAAFSYEYPSVGVVSRWLVHQAQRHPVGLDELTQELLQVLGKDEAQELGQRLDQALMFPWRNKSPSTTKH